MIRRTSIFGLAILGLASCAAVPTQYMPNGYRYQNHDTPLSNPAPTRPWIKEAENTSLEKLGDNTAAWQGAVFELLSTLPSVLPPATTAIVLKPLPPSGPTDQAFDHYLRQALIGYGYTINPVEDGQSAAIGYNASPLSNASTLKAAQEKFGKDFVRKDDTENMYYLTIEVLTASGKLLTRQGSIAILPHEKDEYKRWPGLAYTPTQGRAYDRPVYETRD